MTRVEPHRRDVMTIDASTTLLDAALRMRAEAVGALVVCDSGKPVGMVTDRDLLARGIVARADPARISVAEVMSAPLLTASVTEPLEALIERMSSRAIRRLPLLDGEKLVGIVSLDDLLVVLADELDAIATALRRSDWDAQRRRRHEHVRAWLARPLGVGRELAQRARRGLHVFRGWWPA